MEVDIRGKAHCFVCQELTDKDKLEWVTVKWTYQDPRSLSFPDSEGIRAVCPGCINRHRLLHREAPSSSWKEQLI